MNAERLYEMLMEARRPSDLSKLLESLVAENAFDLGLEGGVEPRVGAATSGFVKHILRLVSHKLGLLVVRRLAYYTQFYLVSGVNPTNFLRVVSLLTNPRDWDELYNILDEDGRGALMNWLRAHIALLMYPRRPESINNFAPVGIEEYARKAEEYSARAKPVKMPGCGVYRVLKVKGLHGSYKLYCENVGEVVTTWVYGKNPLPPRREGLVIDGGAYLGETSVWFADVTPEARIVAVEPGDCNSRVLEMVVRENRLENRIIVERAALWSENTTLALEERGPASQVSRKEGKVRAVTVDYLREKLGEPVSYIKLDVEGAELEALKGAVEALKRDKPFLAISAYHKPLDPVHIARFMREHGYERISFWFPLPSLSDAMVLGVG